MLLNTPVDFILLGVLYIINNRTQMSLPEDLMFLLAKMEGYARNCIQLNSHNAGTVQSGKSISITLPRNSVIDLRTLRFYFECAVSNTNAAVYTRLPADLHSLIRRLTVKIGGRVVMNVDEYSTVYNMLNITRGGAMTKGKEAVNHPYVYTTTSSQNNDIAATPMEPSVAMYCLDSFLSLCEIQPPIIDTGLMPDVIVEFEFMPGDVLVTSTNNTMLTAVAAGVDNNPSYNISNQYFTVDTLTWNDYDSYRSMVNARIGNNNSIDLPFKRYEIYRGSHLGTSVFSVASGSINNVYASFRDSTAYPYTGVATAFQYHNPVNNVMNQSVLKSRYFAFEGFNLTGYKWRVNNQSYPLFDAGPITAMTDIYHNMIDYVKPIETNYFASNGGAFFNANFVLPLKLNHDSNLALMSGADARGTNAII
jgi:hypothetical protein